MKRRFLVIVRAGDRSLHPQWLAHNPQRNWDLVVFYHGDDAQRFPVTGDGVVRIDGKGQKWPALAKLLAETRDAWREYDYVWLPDDDLAADGADINRTFELMAGLGIELAQPSLAWDGQAAATLARHNPHFAVRFSSFVETWGPCFSRALLERVAPGFGATGAADLWTRALASPATQCAILDRVQVTRAGTHDEALSAFAGRNGAGSAVADREPQLALSYGALDRDGRRFNLFDAENGEFVFRLCDGYAGKLADEPAQLGALFAAHARARAEVLNPAAAAAAPAVRAAPVASTSPSSPAARNTPTAPTSIRTAPAQPATAASADAVDRFKQAVAAAAANKAGRAFVPG